MTDYVKEAGTGIGADITPTVQERAIWPALAPFARAKSALWIQAQPRGGAPFSQYDNALDAPTDFWMLDRVGRRVLRKAATAQPRRVIDPDTGRFVMLCPSTRVGPMLCPSVLDAAGVETNNGSFYGQTTGFSVATKCRVAPPSTTMHNTAYGPNTGGVLLSAASATNANNPTIGISADEGRFQVQNRYGTVSWQSGAQFRDGQLHTYIVVYDAQANTIRVWIDGVLTSNSSAIGIVDYAAPSGGSDKLLVGALGAANDLSFQGEWSAILRAPSPYLADDTARAAMLAYLATV